MKAFIALCFLAVAFAEPEAEADPYLLYNSYYPAAYSRYHYTPSVYTAPSVYSAWPRTYGYHYLAKRDAEADAEADPLLYKAINPYWPVSTYQTAYTHAPVVTPVATPVTYTAPVTASVASPVVYKAPVVSYTKPVVYSAPAVVPVATHITQKNGAVESTAAIHSNPTHVNGYANQGQYYANSAGTVHVAKREAEAEADPYLLYSNLGYKIASPYVARTYSPYVARTYSAYAPYTYTYPAAYYY